MKRPRSPSRTPSRKWARAAAEEVVMGWPITALVIGSSAARPSWAAAPPGHPADASTTASAARTAFIVVPPMWEFGWTLAAGDRGSEASPDRAEHPPCVGTQLEERTAPDSFLTQGARATLPPSTNTHLTTPSEASCAP